MTVASIGAVEFQNFLDQHLPSISPEDVAQRRHLLNTARVQAFLDRYVGDVASLLASALGSPLEVSTHSPPTNQESQLGVSLLLRAHGEPLQLMIPLELAQEITSAVLNENCSLLVQQPSEDRLAVLAYFVAKVLAESELFLSQRVYVTEVCCTDRELECNAIDSLTLILQLRISYRHGSYDVRVRCNTSLMQRIRAYADLSPAAKRVSVILEQATISAQLSLIAHTNSLLDIISLQPGTILTIPQHLLRGVLIWTQPRSAGSVRYPLRLASGDESELQFEIIRTKPEELCQNHHQQ